ncbi:MAG: DNA topoisomerase IV subunit A [Alphaproteobacteria bacterium]|nr:DNA topoisomerase IV subunit A [Alphaproteobacteria bacterium]
MTENVTENIRETKLADALSERYLAYAMSTIVSRSLPDVRDGLKPVHRRLLFAMRQLKLDPASGFKKCARVVGDVIGKYHPHGDSSVYEAMVRLAQDFAVRYPLVDGQGNFGNIDGDKAAAMRYTEARLTDVAIALMDGLDDDAVDFDKTYDGEEDEPVVMPAAFPNLLANGSSGIAVGMATNIPPHNVGEVCDALLLLLKKPDTTIPELMNFIQGPDFPTGGVLSESRESIIKTYTTGRGAMKVRAKWEKEDLTHGQYQIIVTEIPYGVQKSDLVMKIAKLLAEKKLPLLADIRDESSDVVRLVLEPKSRTVSAEQLMEHLFKNTDLQINFNLNMNVLDADHTPRVMSIKEVLSAFLKHRDIVLVRRSQYRLNKIAHRMELLQGFLIAYLNLDRVIEIIRNEDEPKAVLMAEFSLTDVQAEAILNMRLRSLRKLEEAQIQKEYEALAIEKAELELLLNDIDLRKKKLAEEIKSIQKSFGQKTELGKRRTIIADAPQEVEIAIEAMIEKEPITVVLSKKGWIRSIKGHLDSLDDLKFKEGDSLKVALKTYTTDYILLFTTNGRFYTILGNNIAGGRGFGEPLRLSVDVSEDADIVTMLTYQPDIQLLVASQNGKGFLVKSNDVIAQTRAGKIILNLADGDKAVLCKVANATHVAVIGTNRKMIVFKTEEIPTMTRGSGVILQRYQEAKLSDVKFFNIEDGLSFPSGNGMRVERNISLWLARRATVGKIPPVGFPRSNKFGNK